MNVARGIVNEHLVPVVSVSIEKEGSDWVTFEMLLDTGFNREVALERSMLDRHCLAPQPRGRRMRVPYEMLESLESWEHDAPYNLNIRWRGPPEEATLHLFPMGPSFPGMLGTALLQNQFVTVDVVPGGKVVIENANPRPEPRRMAWSRQRRVRQWPSSIDNEDEYWEWSDYNLPWTTLRVQDRKGEWRKLWVPVDTGDNGKLSLPKSCVTKLGLTLPEESQMHTPRGIETVSHGNAMVNWQGEERLVECRQREGPPPLIGMKLLEDYRITMDFSYPGPEIEIGRIPRSARTEKGFVDFLASIFRF